MAFAKIKTENGKGKFDFKYLILRKYQNVVRKF